MKKLNIRFEEVTSDKLDEIVDLVGSNRSKVARTALNLGITQLMGSVNKKPADGASASALIGIAIEKGYILKAQFLYSQWQ